MTGSATPKNMSPIPMPAANSIANQVGNEYAGSAWSGPSLISPNRVTANNTVLISPIATTST